MDYTRRSLQLLLGGVLVISAMPGVSGAQSATTSSGTLQNGGTAAPATIPVALPDYLIGADDVLTISVWREQELSGDFAVRPDGKISLLLVNEVLAAGLTTEALRVELNKSYAAFIDAPNVSVTVKEIKSRKIYINGNVSRPGVYPLSAQLTVIQLISLAGGLLDYADKKNIMIIRATPGPNGEPVSVRVNYEEISKGRNLSQNVELKPGDTVIVR